MPTLLLVDDVEEVRVLVRTAVRVRGGFAVVGEAATGAEAVECAEGMQPDLIVLDLGLPDIAGHDVLARLRVVAPEARIIVFTGRHTDDRLVRDTADAYALKDREVEYLVDLLEQQSQATSTHTATIEVQPERTEIRRVRRFVEERCIEWECADRLDDALLVASELATNAALHAGTPFQVTARRRVGALRIDVFDRSERAPELRAGHQDAEGGRGLYLVSAMAASWGVERRAGGGKLVWADLLCAGSD